MQLSMWEIATLGVLALLIFGPDRLPGVARNVGRTVSRVRAEASATIEGLKRSAELEELHGAVDDLRTETRQLRQSVTLTGPEAERPPPPARSTGPPPYDPDAT